MFKTPAGNMFRLVSEMRSRLYLHMQSVCSYADCDFHLGQLFSRIDFPQIESILDIPRVSKCPSFWILNITFKYLLEMISPIVAWCSIGTFANPCIRPRCWTFFLRFLAPEVSQDFPRAGSQQLLVPRCAAFEKLHGAGCMPGGCGWDWWCRKVWGGSINGGASKSSIFRWDFPWNKPSSYWGSPILGKLHAERLERLWIAMETHGYFPLDSICIHDRESGRNLRTVFLLFSMYGFSQSTLGFLRDNLTILVGFLWNISWMWGDNGWRYHWDPSLRSHWKVLEGRGDHRRRDWLKFAEVLRCFLASGVPSMFLKWGVPCQMRWSHLLEANEDDWGCIRLFKQLFLGRSIRLAVGMDKHVRKWWRKGWMGQWSKTQRAT